jgi:hypothetical protein
MSLSLKMKKRIERERIKESVLGENGRTAPSQLLYFA